MKTTYPVRSAADAWSWAAAVSVVTARRRSLTGAVSTGPPGVISGTASVRPNDATASIVSDEVSAKMTKAPRDTAEHTIATVEQLHSLHHSQCQCQ